MAKKKESYEEKIKRLELLLHEMENGELTLDQSISKYEEGMNLYNEMYKILNEAQGKVKILTEGMEEDFEVEN